MLLQVLRDPAVGDYERKARAEAMLLMARIFQVSAQHVDLCHPQNLDSPTWFCTVQVPHAWPCLLSAAQAALDCTWTLTEHSQPRP